MKIKEIILSLRPLRLCGKKSVTCKTHTDGIALIMVLGLLTVMIIMAVTFAISMRTERLAAGNHADNVRARELVQVGLARAMNDLAINLGTSGLFSAMGGQAYPSWNVTNSYTDNPRWNTNIYLVRGSATNYIPRALWVAATNADISTPSYHWQPIESLVYTNSGAATYLTESNLIGRVAYLIINCSGLLDANYAGGSGTTRGMGTSIQEIAIENLAEIGNLKDNFITDRGTHVRYETLADLNARGTFHSPATNLFVYSRALPGYWNNGIVTQVNLAGTANDIDNRRAEITNVLVNIGFSESEAYVIWRNLMDYIDADSVPIGVTAGTPCVEAVPMINEIVCSNNIVQTGAGPPPTYKSFFYINVEWWNSFVLVVADPYVLSNRIDFSNLGGAAVAAVVPSSGYKTKSFTSSSTPTAESFPAFESGDGNDNNFNFRAIITSSILKDGNEVDRVVITGDVSLASPNIGFECDDPRFNGNSSDWRTETSFTLNALNTYCTASTNDGDIAMYVANRPLLSVAEMGYLIYTNAPWRTIKLYGPNRHRVLDVFGLSSNTNDVFITNIVYRGLVNCNPNTATDATAVVFAGMPVDQYPGATPSGNLTMPQARTFAQNIFAGGLCTNLSDIWRNLSQASFPSATNELERESYFRNAFNLINLRQNMFTVIIEAQVASGGNIPRNPAKQRAVAIVWRDPFTGEMFIRHIKWLDD